MHKLKGKSCPGEAICTSDRKDGEIAGVRGRSQGYTLKNHCHNGFDNEGNPLDMISGFREPCPYFDTKPENTPRYLQGAISAAEELKEEKRLGLLKPDLSQLTAFEYVCFRAAEYASDTIEAEIMEEAQTNQGEVPPVEKFGQGGDPFGNW